MFPPRKKKIRPTVSKLFTDFENKHDFRLSETLKSNIKHSMIGKKMNHDRELNIKNMLWGAFLQSHT